MRKKLRAEESVITCLYYKYVQIVVSHECICTTTEFEFQRVKKMITIIGISNIGYCSPRKLFLNSNLHAELKERLHGLTT